MRVPVIALLLFLLSSCEETGPATVYVVAPDPTILSPFLHEDFGAQEKTDSGCQVLRLAPKGETYSSKCYVLCSHTTGDSYRRNMMSMAPAPCDWLGRVIEIDDGQQFKAPNVPDITNPKEDSE